MLAAVLALIFSQAALASPPAVVAQQTPPPTPTTQVGFILDSSGSIGAANWTIIKTGLANALNDPLCVPQNGSVEFTLTSFSTNATVNIAPTLLTANSLTGIVNTVNSLPFLNGTTNISDGLLKTADAMRASSRFSPALKQAVNLVTDGEPNQTVISGSCTMTDPRANSVCWRNYLLSRLQMTGLPDELDGEFIGVQGANSEWKRTQIVFPQPGSYANLATNTFNPGWVLVVPNAAGFSAAVCQKFQQLVEPAGTVTKTPNPSSLPDPGGPVQFTVLVENEIDQPIDVISLSDSPYGIITAVGGSITATTCSVPHTLQPSDGVVGSGSDTYSCTFTANVTGQPGPYSDTVTAGLRSQTGNTIYVDGNATVIITDVPAIIEVVKTASPIAVNEPGGNVTFSFVVDNLSTIDAVTLNSLTDSIYGDLNGQGTCTVPQTIAAGGSYTCSFTAVVSGNARDVHTNVVTAAGVDDDGQAVGDTDDETVTINDVSSSIEVVKTANPTTVNEPGGNVTFSFVVRNTSAVDAVTISSLRDSIYGDLNGQGTCIVPQTIAAGGSYSCAITVLVDGNAGYAETNVVTAAGVDDDGQVVGDTDDETVTIGDVPSSIAVVKTANPTTVNEPGGNVTFSFVVRNTSAVDAVTISSLTDSIYGDLNGQGTCIVPQTIAAGGSYSCAITVLVDGNAGYAETNVVTAAGVDDDGQVVGDTDDETVTINDVPSSIEVVKTANPTTVNEPGGNVTFSFVVRNTSAVDAVTISSLTDSIYGDLNGQGTCIVPQTIAAGGSYSCAITVLVDGNAGYAETNVVTAAGVDDDGKAVGDTDDATVTVNNVPSAIEILKTADPTTVNEPGGNVTFSFVVRNTSAVDAVTISSLRDSIYGDLNGQGTCIVPQTIAAGGSYSCAITVLVDGNAGYAETNVVTAAGVDDDGQVVGDTDDATVTVDDVQAAIEVVKTASPIAVSEPGGNVTFSFIVNNLSTIDAVTLNSLNDSIYGDLNGKGGCTVPQTIAPNGSYACSFTVVVSGNAGDVHTNVVTAAGVDDDGKAVGDTDDATVTIQDVPSSVAIAKVASPGSVVEPGSDVTFGFVVRNTSAVDSVTIDSLTDTIYGDLTAIAGSTCIVPQTIAAGGSYSCAITVFVGGNAGDVHTNVATVTGVDDDGQAVGDDDDETVISTDVPSAIETTKTASPGSVPETGGDVTFTIVVQNTSLVDTVTINTVVDSVFGDVSTSCVPALPANLAPGEIVNCSFTRFISGDAGQVHSNVATATGVDDDGNPVEDAGQEDVTLVDVLPDIAVRKTADPTSVPETGGNVTFTFVVTNNGVETATISSLGDSLFGTLTGDADCHVGTVLAAATSCEFSITRFVSGDFSGDDHINVFTGKATDNDGNEDEDTDDETVDFVDLLPDITVTKSANPISVPMTGGSVLFTFVVTNNSGEAATITALSDDKFGTLSGDADCQVGTVLAGGASCTFSGTFSIPAGDYPGTHMNIFTATGEDNDGNSDGGSDSEIVTFTEVLPSITVTKVVIETVLQQWAFVLRLDGGNPKTVTKDQPTVTWENLVANRSYILSEDEPGEGWVEGSFDCKVNGTNVGEPLPDGDIQLSVVPGDDVVCFKNNADISGTDLDPITEPDLLFGLYLPAITR